MAGTPWASYNLILIWCKHDAVRCDVGSTSSYALALGAWSLSLYADCHLFASPVSLAFVPFNTSLGLCLDLLSLSFWHFRSFLQQLIFWFPSCQSTPTHFPPEDICLVAILITWIQHTLLYCSLPVFYFFLSLFQKQLLIQTIHIPLFRTIVIVVCCYRLQSDQILLF